MSDRTAKRWVKWYLLNPCLAAVLVFLLMYDHPSHVENDSHHYDTNSGGSYTNQSGPDYQSVTLGWRIRQAFNAFAGDPTQAPKIYPDCDRECQRAEQDLGAQLDMALWANMMLWANIVIVAVTGAGVYYVAQTLGATVTAANATLRGVETAQITNEIQRETIKAGQWVHIDICPIATASAPLAWNEDKLSLRFKIALENVGVGPAVNVVARGRDLNQMFGDDSVRSIEEIKVTCKAMSKSLGQIIKPGDTREFPIDIEIGRERAEVMMNGRGEFPSIGRIFVMCCAYYQTPYSEEGVFKRFAFMTMKANGAFGAPIESSDIPLGIDHLIIRRIMADGPDILGDGSRAI